VLLLVLSRLPVRRALLLLSQHVRGRLTQGVEAQGPRVHQAGQLGQLQRGETAQRVAAVAGLHHPLFLQQHPQTIHERSEHPGAWCAETVEGSP